MLNKSKVLDLDLKLQELLRAAWDLSFLGSPHALVHVAGLHVLRGFAVLAIHYFPFLHEAGLQRTHFSCPWSVEALDTLLYGLHWRFLLQGFTVLKWITLGFEVKAFEIITAAFLPVLYRDYLAGLHHALLMLLLLDLAQLGKRQLGLFARFHDFGRLACVHGGCLLHKLRRRTESRLIQPKGLSFENIPTRKLLSRVFLSFYIVVNALKLYPWYFYLVGIGVVQKRFFVGGRLGCLMLMEGTRMVMIGVIGVGRTVDIERMTIRRMLMLLFFYFSGVSSEVLMHERVVVEPVSHVALKLFSLEVYGRNDLLTKLSGLRAHQVDRDVVIVVDDDCRILALDSVLSGFFDDLAASYFSLMKIGVLCYNPDLFPGLEFGAICIFTQQKLHLLLRLIKRYYFLQIQFRPFQRGNHGSLFLPSFWYFAQKLRAFVLESVGPIVVMLSVEVMQIIGVEWEVLVQGLNMRRVYQFVLEGSKEKGADFTHQFVAIHVLLFQLLYSVQQIQFFDEIEAQLNSNAFYDRIDNWCEHKLRQADLAGPYFIHQFLHIGEGTIQYNSADCNPSMQVIPVVLFGQIVQYRNRAHRSPPKTKLADPLLRPQMLQDLLEVLRLVYAHRREFPFRKT